MPPASPEAIERLERALPDEPRALLELTRGISLSGDEIDLLGFSGGQLLEDAEGPMNGRGPPTRIASTAPAALVTFAVAAQ